jgi:hypothetical protein
VWALAFMAPYAFQPAVPGNGRYWYLPAAGLAIALAALAADVATALARRSAATAGTSRAHLRLPALPWVALGLLGLLWTGLLVANLRVSLRAGDEARAVQQGLAGLLRGGGRPARLFVAGHPDFVRNQAGVPLAQVLRYGLSDSLRPPFLDREVARGVPVYPLPPLDGRRLPPPGPELARSRFVVWDAAAGRPEPLPPGGPAGLPTEPGGDLAILYRPRPGSSHRLVVLTEGNPTEVELPPGAEASGWARAELPRRFVESMDRLYGSEVFWWIEAVSLRGEVTATSALHRLEAR